MEFERRVFLGVDPAQLGPAAIEFSRENYYCGGLAGLEMNVAVLDELRNKRAHDIAIEGLRAEMLEFIERQGAKTWEH